MAKKISIFVCASLGLFAAGYAAAQFLWGVLHHRYDQPDTGVYYGHVTAFFDSTDFGDSIYFLRFDGETARRWRWIYPTNFAYSILSVTWHGESAEGTATVSLPSFSYNSVGSTGVLTREILANWLLGQTNRIASTSDARRVDAIYGYFEAAARGSLPSPRHHTYDFEQPVHARIAHFCLGFGVGGFVYLWAIIWLFVVAIFGLRLGSNYSDPDKSKCA